MTGLKKIILIMFLIFITQLRSYALPDKLVNIAFTIDNNYPVYTLLVIDSILKNNKSNSEYCFYIVEQDLTEKNKNLMKNYVEKKGQKIEFVKVDLEKIDNGVNYFTFSNRITPIAMARIMLPELLPEDVEKVIYLDSDILVIDDIANLYNQNLNNYPLGMAVNNYVPKHYLVCPKTCKKKHFYANSGVILFDLKKCRQDKVSQKLLGYLNENKKHFNYENRYEIDAKIFLYPDQDLINVVMDGKIYPLEKKWNNQVINRKSIISIEKSGIIHYIGKVKPWYFPNNPDNANGLYIKYWKESQLCKYYYSQRVKMWLKKIVNIYMYKIYRIFTNLKRANIFIFDNILIFSGEN